MSNKLETKAILNKPGVKPVGAVIWMHGLGADYNDFVPIVEELKLPFSLKFVFPNAPIIPVTINNGYQMRAWYDITDFSSLTREVDSAGILENRERIHLLIENLIQEGFKPEEIIIAGFSQGGVMAYYTGLGLDYSFAGIMILSAYLPDTSLIDVAKIQHKLKMPFLICHGQQDPVVSIDYAREAVKYLQSLDVNYQWFEYPMPHSVCYEEVVTNSNWIKQIFRS